MKFQLRSVFAFFAASSILACGSFNEASTDNTAVVGGMAGSEGGAGPAAAGATNSGTAGAASNGVGGVPSNAAGGVPSNGVGGVPSNGVGGVPNNGVGGSPSNGVGGTANPAMGGAATGGSADPGIGGAADPGAAGSPAVPPVGNDDRIRMIVSSDIGGSDNDDYQTMAQLMVYADQWDLQGLIASPWGDGRAKHYQVALDAYEKDYPNLKTYSDKYPTPEEFRALVVQGAEDKIPSPGYAQPTAGSRLIIEKANNGDPRPLWITVWGCIDDVVQAVHDDPTIAPKIRVYWIGGPNKKHSNATYPYLEKNHKDLWMIESNTTYRGYFNGGNMSGDLSNSEFPKQHVAGHGAIGEYFMDHRADVKMGDSPALSYLLKAGGNVTEDPTKPGWGGQYVLRSGFTHWWTDDTDSSAREGDYPGAKHVSKWREPVLRDFQKMMERAKAPKQ